MIIASLGGIVKVLQAISAHPKGTLVQVGCRFLLENLTLNEDPVEDRVPWRRRGGAACEMCAPRGSAGAGVWRLRSAESGRQRNSELTIVSSAAWARCWVQGAHPMRRLSLW